MLDSNIVQFPNRYANPGFLEIQKFIRDEPALGWSMISFGAQDNGLAKYSSTYQHIIRNHVIEIERVKEVDENHLNSLEHLLTVIPWFKSDFVRFEVSAMSGSTKLSENDAQKLFSDLDRKYRKEENGVRREGQNLLAQLADDPFLRGEVVWRSGQDTFDTITKEGWHCRVDLSRVPVRGFRAAVCGRISVSKQVGQLQCLETGEGEVAAGIAQRLLGV
jgi:hypothetical protein